jgi:pyridoxamine 5'-phosphate oxidase
VDAVEQPAAEQPAAEQPLDEGQIDPDPVVQFRRWYDDAQASGVLQPDAMLLATTDEQGVPDARVVLLRGIVEQGFQFFTNYESRKGRELAAHPHAAVVFHWRELQRQVRARGRVETVSDEAADVYWNGRPRASRISAWASAQSAPIASRVALEARGAAIEARFGTDGELPRPPFWGGYLVVVDELELWQQREHRFHDRLRYTCGADGGWQVTRLQP